MLKSFLLVLFTVFSISITAQDIFKKSRPWDPAWRIAYRNQVARLKSDSLNIIVRKGAMEATIENRKGEKNSLEALLDSLHGNIVVLVTWNKDCPGEFYTFLDMFPLMAEFAKQPVAFVFLNTYNRKEDWKVYSSSGRLSEIEHNYRLTNFNESQFARTFGSGRSTRILLDRQGRLCNAYAPSPEDGLAGYVRNLLKDDQFESLGR